MPQSKDSVPFSYQLLPTNPESLERIAEGNDSTVYRLGPDWVYKKYDQWSNRFLSDIVHYGVRIQQAIEVLPELTDLNSGITRIGRIQAPYHYEINPITLIGGKKMDFPYNVSPYVPGIRLIDLDPIAMIYKNEKLDYTKELTQPEKDFYDRLYQEAFITAHSQESGSFLSPEFKASWMKLSLALNQRLDCLGIEIVPTNVKLRVAPSGDLRMIITDLCGRLEDLT